MENKTITICGASDDIIEIDGDFSEEFNAYHCWKYVHFNDGTIVKGGYSQVPDKGWVFEVVQLGEETRYQWLDPKLERLDPKLDDVIHFSDRLQLCGQIFAAACWKNVDGPSDDEIEEHFEDLSSYGYTAAKLREAFIALNEEPINIPHTV